MKSLILSCDTGGGHNSCSAAIKEVFEEHGTPCDTVDVLRFISSGFARFMSWGHTTMYRKFPGVFKFGYSHAESHPSMFQEYSPIYKLLTSGTEALFHFLQEGGYDTVICVHVFSSLVLTAMLEKFPMELRTCFVATDYTCSPSVGESDLDLYFIPDETLAEEFVHAGVKKERIVASGIPVRKCFYQSSDKTEAKERLGIPGRDQHILMMCGSMGCGPMEELAEEFAKNLNHRQHLSVICGTNKKLADQLKEQFRSCRNIHIYGFVSDMSMLMDSADLYITKPGGLSVSESAAKGLPMALIDAVSGCESYNLRFWIRKEGAVTALDAKGLAAICQVLLCSPYRLEAMHRALKTAASRNSAERIFTELMKPAKESSL